MGLANQSNDSSHGICILISRGEGGGGGSDAVTPTSASCFNYCMLLLRIIY